MESGRVDAVGGGDLPDGPTLTTKSHSPPEVELDPGPAELGATPLGGLEPGVNPLPAQLPFQLGHGGDNREREPPGRRARVDAVVRGDEVDAPGPEVVERDHEVADRPGEAVEAPTGHEVRRR